MASGILAAIAALVTAIYAMVAGQQGPSDRPIGPPDRASIEQRVSELRQAVREFVQERTALLVPDRVVPQQAPPVVPEPLVPEPQAPAGACAHTRESGPGWITYTTSCTSTSASGTSGSVAQSVTSSSSSVTVQTDVTK